MKTAYSIPIRQPPSLAAAAGGGDGDGGNETKRDETKQNKRSGCREASCFHGYGGGGETGG